MPYWRLYYHITWGVKNRLPLIHTTIEDQLHSAIAAKAIELEATVHAVGGIEDHIHLVVSVPPKVALSQLIGAVKGNSSHFANHVLQLEVEFHWQAEYGVVSFNEKDLPFVVRYVHNQREHHCQSSLIEKLAEVA